MRFLLANSYPCNSITLDRWHFCSNYAYRLIVERMAKNMNNFNIDLNDTNGIISIDEVRNVVEAMKRKKLDALFTEAKEQRKVWKGEGKDQRWKFKKDDGTLVAKTSEEKIKEEYLKYLETKSLESEKNTATFADLYSAWLNYKKEQVGTDKGQLSPSTFRRYQRDYERYIKGTSFDKMLVIKITAIDIETFLKSMVTKHKLTKRCFTNISG